MKLADLLSPVPILGELVTSGRYLCTTLHQGAAHWPRHARDQRPAQARGILRQEASRFTASLLKDQRVRLEIQASPRSRDRYGRLLAFFFRESDNLLVNKEIIRQGFGHAYTKYPFDPARMEEFRAAEREAREHQRDLWGP